MQGDDNNNKNNDNKSTSACSSLLVHSRPAFTLQTQAVSFNFKFPHSIHPYWIHSALRSRAKKNVRAFL